MKKISVLLIVFCCVTFISCRKSARNQRERFRSTEIVTESDRDGSPTKEVRERRTSSSQKRENSKRSNHKLEGSQVFDRYGNAVFMIFTSDGSNGYQGSGFFVSNDGLAVSNYHVFKGTTIGREQIKLAGSNKSYSVAKVLHKSEKEDFIVFKVNCQNTNYIPIAKSKPKIGDKVYAIGSPRGLENTFSSGEVSQWRADNLMQISALIDHGSSGGALINEYGEAIGITSGSFADGSQANLNYAWSIDVVKPYRINPHETDIETYNRHNANSLLSRYAIWLL